MIDKAGSAASKLGVSLVFARKVTRPCVHHGPLAQRVKRRVVGKRRQTCLFGSNRIVPRQQRGGAMSPDLTKSHGRQPMALSYIFKSGPPSGGRFFFFCFVFSMHGGYLGNEFAVVFSREVAVEEPGNGNGVVGFRFTFGFVHEGGPYEDFSWGKG